MIGLNQEIPRSARDDTERGPASSVKHVIPSEAHPELGDPSLCSG